LDTIFDTPQTFVTDAGPYAPHNYDGKFAGAMTLERALAESRNIPAVRLAAHVGISTVIDYARRFGIREHIPPFLPAALGAADVTLMEQTSAFSTFPNDGLRALPHYIVKVTDYDGRILEETPPIVQDVISPDTARTMTWMLRQVIQHGTASAAFRLGTPLAGKTGTTNNFTDAWFIGFSPSITCGVWVGFDEKKSLGEKETGARAALPIWMDFMAAARFHQPSHADFSAPPTFFERTVATQGDQQAPWFGQVPPDAQPALSGSRSVIPASKSDPVPSAIFPNQ
ncbi:MAG TPA: penicillin-binding transpeptidase domain-containing protein, partial [Candidatus Bathyarchaeia archaeon]|nr:penicillin-binding transpeptidase domain-containing protein [Candidatus Bathyarchaeia archaeon]